MSNRRQRRLDHVKTQKGDIGKGFPSKQEARQGHTVTKYIDGQGLFEFTYYNNQWFKKKLETANQTDMTTSSAIHTSNLIVDETIVINGRQKGSVIGIKAEDIENTPYAGTVTPSYIGGAIGNLKLTQPVTEKGQIGFDSSTDSFEFKQSANDKITYDGSTFKSIRDVNDGNPSIEIGSSDAEGLVITTTYASGAKGLSNVTFGTRSASGVTDIGQMIFSVDGSPAGKFNDSGLYLYSGKSLQSPGDLTLDIEGDLTLDANGGQVWIKDNAANHFLFDCDNTGFIMYDDVDAGDFFSIYVTANGSTTISTVDNNAAAGHLNIEPDGHVEFDGCGVGFDKGTATFSTSGEIGDGNDSTDVDFRLGNKFELTLTNNISGSSEFINMIFPNTSGNFLLLLIQDGTGSRTVHANGWVAYAHDESACDNLAGANGTDGAVRWAGGTAPTLTTAANKSDIISIYWDADNQTAFCVPSLNF